jgi:hypothetical protein
MFLATADSLFGVVAPTEEEFIIVNAYNDGFPPAVHITSLVKPCRKNRIPAPKAVLREDVFV